MNTVWRLVLIAIAVWLAVVAVKFVLHLAFSLLSTVIWLAVVVGIIWLVVQIFGQKKAY